MKSYNRLIALTVFYESFNDSYDSATWLPHNHNRVDKQNAVKGRFGVNTAMHYALFAKNAAVLTTRTPWKEAAEKVPLNYRITCILCLANIIATC